MSALRALSPGGARAWPSALDDLATLGLAGPARRAGRALLASGVQDPVLLRGAVLALLASGASEGAELALLRWADASGLPGAAFRYGMEQAARRRLPVLAASWARRVLDFVGSEDLSSLAAVVRGMSLVGRPGEARAVRRWVLERQGLPGDRRSWAAALSRGAPSSDTGPVEDAISRYRRVLHEALPLAHRPGERAGRKALAEALLRDPCRFDRPALLLLAAAARGRRLSEPLRWCMIMLRRSRRWRP